MGVFQAKSQNKFTNLEEHRAFKQNLMNEAQTGYNNQILSQNLSKQKNLLAANDYGDAPDLNWAGQFGGSGNDFADAIISDEDGNIFITGSFSGQISVLGNNYVATGKKEAYVAKFDNTGNLIWFTQIPATENNETYCHDICMDTDGHLYVTGYYTGAITVGVSSLPDINEYSLFYAKLDYQGNLTNGAYHSQNENEIGLFIDTDENGYIYITCSRATNTESRHESWILKYNQSANLVWEQQHDEGFNDIIVIGSSIYYTGVIRNFDDGIIDENVSLPIPNGYNDVFIAKSDLNGIFEWGIEASHNSYGDSYESYFETDNNGSFYMAGSYRQDIILGDYSISGDGGFVTKFDESGNFNWLSPFGEYRDTPKLAVDNSGNSYVLEDDIMAKYDTYGNVQWIEELDHNAKALYYTS